MSPSPNGRNGRGQFANRSESNTHAASAMHSIPGGATDCQADNGTEPAAASAMITAHPASDPRMAGVVEAWPQLTEGQRAEVLKIVGGQLQLRQLPN